MLIQKCFKSNWRMVNFNFCTFLNLFHFIYSFVPFQNFRISKVFFVKVCLTVTYSEKFYLKSFYKISILLLLPCFTMETYYSPSPATIFGVTWHRSHLFWNAYTRKAEAVSSLVAVLFPEMYINIWNAEGTQQALLK